MNTPVKSSEHVLGLSCKTKWKIRIPLTPKSTSTSFAWAQTVVPVAHIHNPITRMNVGKLYSVFSVLKTVLKAAVSN